MTQDAVKGSLLGKIATYTELLEKDPCSSIFIPLSDAYRQLGMLEEAVEIVQKGILENPAFAEGYVAYGRILLEQNLFDEAVGELEKALILDKKRLSALKLLAKVRVDQGDHKTARSLLRRAVEIKDDSSIRKMLDLVESKLKEPLVEAVEPAVVAKADAPMVMPGAVEASPVDLPREKPEKVAAPISTATIAELYIRQGFPEKALKVYRDLLRADPQNEFLRQKLVQLKQQQTTNDLEEDDDLTSYQDATDIAVPVSALDTSNVSFTPEAEVPAASLNIVEETMATPLVEPVSRSLVDVFNGWLDAISHRREAHV